MGWVITQGTSWFFDMPVTASSNEPIQIRYYTDTVLMMVMVMCGVVV